MVYKAWADLEKGKTTVKKNNNIFLSFLDRNPELREEIQKGMTSPYVLSIFNNMVEDANFAIAVPNIRNAGFRTAILTNNAFQDERRQRSIRLENAIKVHDAVIESCRIGYRKPEKEIYLIAASQLNVEPKECIFIDDLEENCKGAQEVGMTAIQENGNDSLSVIKELEKLLDHKLL
ncbi:Bifunctional epoxide hydrolase 2 [Toxocara canis]|uniref:Bifunctional epoxide hydrolase 2 n=1 Tax=Toxocara canis TaxID=6265 RepID=A0A0B2UU53_TOXCA|nr:Bifunctional epoxide hydrolase 2 [Toxocara canis]